MVQARCMKCKKQVDVLNGREEVTSNGMNMLKGKCKCGTTVCKILGKAK